MTMWDFNRELIVEVLQNWAWKLFFREFFGCRDFWDPVLRNRVDPTKIS